MDQKKYTRKTGWSTFRSLQSRQYSASLWDLIARALPRILFRADQASPLAKHDKRCASASRMCAVIERATLDDQGQLLGTAEIEQVAGQKGRYTVRLTEDILELRTAEFSFGLKSLNATALLLRALCFALGTDNLCQTNGKD